MRSGHATFAPAQLFGTERSIATTRVLRAAFANALLDPSLSLACNQCISIHFAERPDPDILYSALLNLLQRHESLRSHFTADGRQLRIRERIAFELPIVRIDGSTPEQRQAHHDRCIRAEMAHVFDLTEGPLFRALLLDRGPDGQVLVFNCHATVVDGWSLNVIMTELPVLYSDLVAGRSETSLPPADSLSDSLREVVAREQDAGATLAHWQQVFADGVPVLDLATDRPRPHVRSYQSRREDYRVDAGVYELIRAAGARHGVSQFITLLSAFTLFVARLSGQRDFIIGVPTPGQLAAGKRHLLGNDTRTLPIRCTVEDDDTFDRYTQRIRDRFFTAYDNQWISLPDLSRALGLKYDPSRGSCVAVVFGFDAGFDEPFFRYGELKATHYFNPRLSEEFELQINAVVEHGTLVIECAYNESLFDAEQIHRRLEQFECLMRSIGERPERKVLELALVPPAQIEQMDRVLNRTQMPFERTLCVDQLVERSVRGQPDKVAVEWNGVQLTYRALWDRSGEVARALVKAGAGPQSLIGVMLERSADLVAVLLGVWRAGGAFVPLDPAYPEERLDYMIEHSGMKLIVTDRPLQADKFSARPRCIDLREIAADGGGEFQLRERRESEHLAYVIYTSGSTGKPKGVQVPHRSLNNFLTTMQTQSPGFSADRRLLAVTTLSFDIAELELWLPLVSGATTVVADRATVVDGPALAQTLRDQRINVLQATPSTWRLLLMSGWPGDPALTGLCGGEALPPDLADALRTRTGALWNMYGPTETTVWSTIDRVTSHEVTIGKPIGNTQTYVLDTAGAWVPWGSLGELWIGGDGVTHGYLAREDLTRERFLPNPFTGQGQMYRTGDVVRLRQDGRIEYVGRNDFQVKVRGYRIELGDVQHALARLREIRQCVVVVREREPGDAHLVAYYTLRDGTRCDVQDLRGRLRQALPEYMVPGWFVELPQLPLTDNGKIHVKALPDPFHLSEIPQATATGSLERAEAALAQQPDIREVALVFPEPKLPDSRPLAFVVARGSSAPSPVSLRRALRGHTAEQLIPDAVIAVDTLPRVRGAVDRARLARLAPGAAAAPRSPAEALLASLWRDTLAVPAVGRDDNFFQLGGDQIAALEVVVRAMARSGTRLDTRLLITENLAQLARRLASAGDSGGST
jgi:amino acid adenylation domain-containing protein